MTEFKVLPTVPQEWFKFENNRWYAKTHLSNCENPYEKKDTSGFHRADLIQVHKSENIFIPISLYDEHQNGKALLKEFYSQYGVRYEDYTPLFLYGYNYPNNPQTLADLKNVLSRLKDSNIDLSNAVVSIEYLTSDNKEDNFISVDEFLADNYTADVIVKPLTKVGEELVKTFENFRDCFNVKYGGKYHCGFLRKQLKKLYNVVKKYDLTTEEEFDNIMTVVDLYEQDEIPELELMEKLFAFNGFRNNIHDRIRDRLEDEDFIKLVGNPEMLNNIMDIM